jgi:hypothetical protein
LSRTWTQGLLALPGVGVAMLPKLACPLCWPAYAVLLSSLGLGFLISTRYLLPLTVAFLLLALVALAFRATQRHGYGPFLLGLLAVTGLFLGKFVWESKPTIYGAVVMLVVASLWNAWPRRATSNGVTICKQLSEQS